MITVRTGSRLHFGLFNVGGTDQERRFGGVGMMVEEPALCLEVTAAREWGTSGPLAARVMEFASRFRASFQSDLPPFHLHLAQAPPSHAGLGSGTQLGLAVAQALAAQIRLPIESVAELAQMVGRGQRSALGVHGFAHGGFLVEAGRSPGSVVAPLVAVPDFPERWRVVLLIPQTKMGIHGAPERAAFEALATQPTRPGEVDALCRLVLLGMLPALVEKDLPAFGEALYEFNRRAGEPFAAIQGGIYASPGTATLVEEVRRLGVRGVGQSSWGPTVFAVVGSEAEARELRERIWQRWKQEELRVMITEVRRRGAEVCRRREGN